jgi:hypothetical protein
MLKTAKEDKDEDSDEEYFSPKKIIKRCRQTTRVEFFKLIYKVALL